jgi:oligopeptidase B
LYLVTGVQTCALPIWHGGASGRFDYLKEKAIAYAFYLALEGKTDPLTP